MTISEQIEQLRAQLEYSTDKERLRREIDALEADVRGLDIPAFLRGKSKPKPKEEA